MRLIKHQPWLVRHPRSTRPPDLRSAVFWFETAQMWLLSALRRFYKMLGFFYPRTFGRGRHLRSREGGNWKASNRDKPSLREIASVLESLLQPTRFTAHHFLLYTSTGLPGRPNHKLTVKHCFQTNLSLLFPCSQLSTDSLIVSCFVLLRSVRAAEHFLMVSISTLSI